ncbi:Uncharacterized protein TCM_035271 [Theobroma cacao]|uniref:Uncharacterized protein n=1 Tax=Theobroma cacao TaxID=3641 RepID=A0A061FHU0_THECC|nr:Uncharacterized protein TCM_035271 [Theobroma cacao]
MISTRLLTSKMMGYRQYVKEHQDWNEIILVLCEEDAQWKMSKDESSSNRRRKTTIGIKTNKWAPWPWMIGLYSAMKKRSAKPRQNIGRCSARRSGAATLEEEH